jgi:hypothetical protein
LLRKVCDTWRLDFACESAGISKIACVGEEAEWAVGAGAQAVTWLAGRGLIGELKPTRAGFGAWLQEICVHTLGWDWGDVLPWSLHSMADICAARTEEKIGHSGRDDDARNKITQEHSPFDFAQSRQESSRKNRGMGRRWL